MTELAASRPRRRVGALVISLFVVAAVAFAAAVGLAGTAAVGSLVAAAGPEPCCPAGGPPAEPSAWPDPGATDEPTTLPTRPVPLPSCLVGSWRVTGEVYLFAFFNDTGPLPFRSGGREYEFRADGTGTVRYDNVTATGNYRGEVLRVDYHGSMEFSWSADDSRITYHRFSDVDLAWRTYRDSRLISSGVDRQSPPPEEDEYRCAGSTMEEWNEATGYQASWVRTDRYGVYG